MEKGKVDMELIRRYVRGELSPREMYALERQAQADPMLMDVILGVEQEALAVHDDNLADIRKRIAARTGEPQKAIRRLAPVQRWAIAASILAVLTVGTWWFVREDTVEQHEATVAATSKGMPETEAEALQEPISPPAKAQEADTAPQAGRIASAEALAAHPAEKQDVRLAKVTPKAGISANPPDSTVVVGYGTQKKSALAGATARLVAAEMDSPVVVNGEALAGRTHGIRIRGISASPARMQPVVGKVVDKETQEPLAGVAIQFTDGHTVATDKQGRFEAIDSSQILTARYIGYETQTIRINGRDSVTIALRPSKTGLGEVVVVGYGQLRHQTEAENVGHTENKPTPKNGWAAYRQYLKDAAKLAPGKGGAVELTFTVDDSGRPTDVAIVKTSNVELNKFATLIVRDGPLWVPGVNDERKVTLRIDF